MADLSDEQFGAAVASREGVGMEGNGVLADLPGCQVLTKVEHPRQRNETWLVRHKGIDAVAKRYQLLSTDSVAELCAIESQLRMSGLPVPGLVHRSAVAPVAVHALVSGSHVTDPTPEMVADCARLFASQLEALRSTRAGWAPSRPSSLPWRARTALDSATDTGTRELVTTSWQVLSPLAHSAEVTSHADWRADNILFDGGKVAAVLDWEDLIRLPAAEAIGYAAASLTHSWREELYAPVALEPIELFLAFTEESGVLPPAAKAHAHTAALYAAGVRLAEDQKRGAAILSSRQLRTALRGAL